MQDLFEVTETLPQEVRRILNKFSEDWEESYSQCNELLKALQPLGYTFDYYLDAVPYDLRLITPEPIKPEEIEELIIYIQSILDQIKADDNFWYSEEHEKMEKAALNKLPYNFETDDECYNYCLKATPAEIWEYHLTRLKKIINS